MKKELLIAYKLREIQNAIGDICTVLEDQNENKPKEEPKKVIKTESKKLATKYPEKYPRKGIEKITINFEDLLNGHITKEPLESMPEEFDPQVFMATLKSIQDLEDSKTTEEKKIAKDDKEEMKNDQEFFNEIFFDSISKLFESAKNK